MKFCELMYTMILDGDYPNDIRVRKEAESLAANGTSIQVITRWKKGQERKESIHGVRVYRLGKHYSFRKKGVNDIISSIFFFDFLFYFRLKSFFKDNKIGSVIHVHDLPLIRTIRFLFPYKFLVLDMHENYPEMLLALKMTRKSFLKGLKDRLFFSTKRWKIFEKKAILLPDRIIAVIDEMKIKLINEYKIQPTKIDVISNYEKLEFQSNTIQDDFEFKKDVFYITYVGGISPVRGLEIVIKAICKLNDTSFNVQLIIVGNGNPSYLNSLRTLSSSLGIEEKVHFLGLKPFEKINYYIHNSGANVIPHVKNAHTDNTIPHKLFQIMMSKSPLLVSNCNPLRRIVGDSKAGFVFEAGDVGSFTKQILFMIENKPIVRERIGNAYNLVENELNWDIESEKLIKLIKEYEEYENGVD